MKKFLLIIIILAVVGGAGYFFWQNRNEYLFQGDKEFETEDETEDQVDEEAERIIQQEDSLEEDDDDDEEAEEDAEDEDEFKSDESEYKTPVVTNDHCDNECEDFSDKEEKAYCQEICGLAEDDKDRKSDDCDELEKLERDACYKQKAVNEKDMSICEEIEDENLKENCLDRVMEEILDQNRL